MSFRPASRSSTLKSPDVPRDLHPTFGFSAGESRQIRTTPVFRDFPPFPGGGAVVCDLPRPLHARQGLRTDHTGDQEGEDEERIERKECMRTIEQKFRVRPTIRLAIVTLTVCWATGRVVEIRDIDRRSVAPERVSEAGPAVCRVHRRGAVYRMPRPGEQAFQRDAACEGLPAEPEERPPAAGVRSLPRTGLGSRQERHSTRPR